MTLREMLKLVIYNNVVVDLSDEVVNADGVAGSAIATFRTWLEKEYLPMEYPEHQVAILDLIDALAAAPDTLGQEAGRE